MSERTPFGELDDAAERSLAKQLKVLGAFTAVGGVTAAAFLGHAIYIHNHPLKPLITPDMYAPQAVEQPVVNQLVPGQAVEKAVVPMGAGQGQVELTRTIPGTNAICVFPGLEVPGTAK